MADVFENCRKTCKLDLDPAHYYTAIIAFDAVLKMSKIELKLLGDIDIESRIRGGRNNVQIDMKK